MAALKPTHYDVLGLACDADAVEIRSAWKLHVQAWHPDRFTGPMREEAEKRTSRINEAYTVLRDGSRRAAYDCRLAADTRDAERLRSPIRPSVKVRPAAPRAAATPIGTPMAGVEAADLREQLDALAVEVLRSAGRHPRLVVAMAAATILMLGSGALVHAFNAPSLPTDATIAAAVPRNAARITPSDTLDLEALAEESRREAAAADSEMSRLMARDDAEARAADAEADAADAAAARALAAKAGKAAQRGQAPRRRIVRVMPTTSVP